MAHCTSCLGDAEGHAHNFVFSVPTFAARKAQSSIGQRTVIVIGGGLSGLSAAIEVLSQGARVVLIEKERILGSNSVYRLEGFNAVGSMAQREKGIQDSSDLFVKDMERAGGAVSNFPALFARHSLEGVVFLSELGLPLRSLCAAPGHSVARTLRPENIRNSIGEMVVNVLKQYVEGRSDSTDILFCTQAVSLLMKEGKVTGVRYQVLESGQYAEVEGECVIIATGGFAANAHMLHQYAPTSASLPLSTAVMSQGEGIKLAMRDASAALVDMDRVNLALGVLDRKNPRAAMVLIAEELRTLGALLVNSRGERFVDETGTSRYVIQAMQRYSQPLEQGLPVVAHMILNEKAVNQFQRGALAFYQSRGLVSKFGSAGAAAQALNFPANWGVTVAEDLKTAKSNGKDRFGRRDLPEFSASETILVLTVTPTIGATLGGLKVTKDCQVINTSNSPIGGLYAVGSVVGGLHGAEILAGNALLSSIVFSRLAARGALGATRPGRLISFGGVDFSAAFAELGKILGAKMSRKIPDLVSHSHDASYHAYQLPLAVIFPEETKDVSATLTICHRHSLPVVPWGMGSSLEGHSTPVVGGIVVSLQKMKSVLEIHEGDMQVTVQPGIRQRELNAVLMSKGIFFPVDPGSNPTLGGMVANGSSGTTTVGYGTMRDNVRSLEAVLADGTVIVSSSRARKSSAGYDLTHLLIGSEGTLAIVTAITLKLYKLPTSVAAAVASFPSVDMAARTVMATLQKGVPVHRIELLNALAIDAVNKKFDMKFQLRPTLFLEFHGSSRDAVLQAAAAFREAATPFGLVEMSETAEEKEREVLWKARHGAYFACNALRPHAKMLITDICVPLSRFAEAIVETEKDFAAAKPALLAPIVGHAGDGNFHVMVPFDVSSPAEVATLTALNARLVRRALHFGGTCTGEHGVGLGKREWLEEEHGKPAVDLMRQIRKAIDPKGILNPDKVVEMPTKEATKAKL